MDGPGPTVVTVAADGTGDVTTIGAAVRAAAGRSGRVRVTIADGWYAESVTVPTGLELVAATAGGVVVEPPTGAALTVAARSGDVRVEGLVLVGAADDTVDCADGLLLDRCLVRGTGPRILHGRPGSRVTLRDCRVDGGATWVSAGVGVVEDTTFDTTAGDAAVVVREGGEVTMTACRVRGSTGAGVLVVGARASIVDCDIADVAGQGVSAYRDATLTLTGSRIAPGSNTRGSTAVSISTGSRATVRDTAVHGGEQGVNVDTGASAHLRGLTVDRTADGGVLFFGGATGRVEDCRITRSATTALAVHEQASPEVVRCHIAGAGTGVWVAGGGSREPRFDDVEITEVGGSAVRLDDAARTSFARLRVDGCEVGISCSDADTRAEVADSAIRDARRAAVVALGSSRLSVLDSVVERGGIGVQVAGTARVSLRDTRVADTARAAVVAGGQARLHAERLTVTGARGSGLRAEGAAHLEVDDSSFTGVDDVAIHLSDDCDGRVTGCTAAALDDLPVVNTSRVVVEGLRTGPAESPAASPVPPGPATRSGPGAPDLPRLTELDRLIGLEPVKAQVRTEVNLVRNARQRELAGLPVPPRSRHLVFTGPPGTGKTTVARLYGALLADLGVLSTGELIEVSRGDLVGEYLGATALKTRAAVDRATGGVLFIDEAHALARRFGAGTDLGQEAIDELVKLMEDRRDDLVIIAAGYTDEMAMFLDANPGLRSRFSRTIAFPAHRPDELIRIVGLLADQHAYRIADDALTALRGEFERRERAGAPANARDARTLFERMIERQAERLAATEQPSRDQLVGLTADDLPDHP